MRLISAFLLATLCTFARADYKDAPGATQAAYTLDTETITSAVAVNYPNDVGGGAVIDTAGYTSMSCEIAKLNDGGGTISVIPKCYSDSTGVTATYVYPTMTCAVNASARYTFDPRTSAATADTGVTDSPSAPCRYMKITAAAAVGVGTLSCTLRR